MAEENMILSVCPSCGEKYTLSADLLGQVAECAQCGNEFTIAVAVKNEKGEDVASPDSVVNQPTLTNTSTTKIPKMNGNVGMVPQVEDQFNLNVVHTNQTATKIRKFTKPQPKAEPPKPEKKPWWKVW